MEKQTQRPQAIHTDSTTLTCSRRRRIVSASPEPTYIVHEIMLTIPKCVFPGQRTWRRTSAVHESVLSPKRRTWHQASAVQLISKQGDTSTNDPWKQGPVMALKRNMRSRPRTRDRNAGSDRHSSSTGLHQPCVGQPHHPETTQLDWRPRPSNN